MKFNIRMAHYEKVYTKYWNVRCVCVSVVLSANPGCMELESCNIASYTKDCTGVERWQDAIYTNTNIDEEEIIVIMGPASLVTIILYYHSPRRIEATASQPVNQPAAYSVMLQQDRSDITLHFMVYVCVCLMCGCWCTTHKEVIVIVVVWRPSSIHRAYCKIYACGLENDFFSILCCVFLVLVHRCGRLFSSRSHQQRIPNQYAVNASAAREESMLPSANIFERCTILFSICSNDCQYEQKWSTEQKVLCCFDFIVRNYAVYLTFNALRVARHTFNEFHVHTQLTVSMGCYRASLNTPKWTETFAL